MKYLTQTRRFVVGALTALAAVLVVTAPAAAKDGNGDEYGCPPGTTFDYKIDDLTGATFTVPAVPNGWTITGVSIKAGPAHQLFTGVGPGSVIQVKAIMGHDVSHAHICKGEEQETTTTTAPATTTTQPETTTTAVETTTTVCQDCTPVTLVTVPETTTTTAETTTTTVGGATTTTAPAATTTTVADTTTTVVTEAPPSVSETPPAADTPVYTCADFGTNYDLAAQWAAWYLFIQRPDLAAGVSNCRPAASTTGGALPSTGPGRDVTPQIGFAVAAIAGGAALMFAARRRRSA
jgi:hypothetical protein